MTNKTRDHLVADMMQREAFQAMAKLWKPIRKLRHLACAFPKQDRDAVVKLLEEMEGILTP